MQHTTRRASLPFRDKDELLNVMRIISNTQVSVHFMDGLRSFNVKESGTPVFFKGLIPCCFATQRTLQITNGQAKVCRVTSHVQQGLGAADEMRVTVCV
jgi:hypothetical protein